MQAPLKFYCPRCGAEYEMEEWDRFDYEEFGRFDTLCDGCGCLFRIMRGVDGRPWTY